MTDTDDTSKDPVTDYARAVAAGEVVAGPHVRAACARHLADLERKGWGFVWRPELVDRLLTFYRTMLLLSGGEHEGKPFEVLPWQAFVVGSIVGWVSKADGRRRFRRVYVETAKGSGKTPLAGGLALYMATSDGEPGAHCYVIARTGSQALDTFRPITEMVGMSPEIRRRAVVTGGEYPHNVAFHELGGSGSFIRRVNSSTAAKGQSGPIPHFVLVDEYHEHDTDAMLDRYERGVKSRRQPVVMVITNAGAGTESPCGMEHEFAAKVAAGDFDADYYFSFICGLDEGDDPWTDEAVWPKANPSLPSIPGPKYLRQVIAQSQAMPSKRAQAERLNFCRWTEAESPWIDREHWVRAERKRLPGPKGGARVWLGLDLSATKDLTAAAMTWEGRGAAINAEVSIWTPRDTLAAREEGDHVPYIAWWKAGHIHACRGRTIDYAVIAAWVREVMGKYDVVGMAFDPWHMGTMQAELRRQGIETRTPDEWPSADSLLVVPHPQGFQTGIKHRGPARRGADRRKGWRLWMAQSINDIERAILEGRLRVAHNPALRWAVLGGVAVQDAQLNRRFMKNKSTTRIDALVALTMAVGYMRATQREGGDEVDISALVPMPSPA